MPRIPDDIVDIRPCSLIGAAKFVREWYIHNRIMSEDQTLILLNPQTGESDIARPISEDERIKRRLEKAQTEAQKKKIAKSKRAQREATRKRRYRQRQKELRDSRILGN